MNLPSLGSTAVAGSLFVFGALPSKPALSQSLEGAYTGSLECKQMPASTGILRTPLAIIVRNGRVVASAPIFDIDGTHEISSAVATGTVDADGVLHLAYSVFTRDADFHGDYTGTLHAAGGTLIGTQVWTRGNAGGGVTRTCAGTIFEAKSPRQ
jgi:hypothetical protein